MGTRGPSYQTLSVADDRHERSKKDSATRQQARLRCGFLLLCPLLPAVIFLLALDGGTSTCSAWKPSPRKEVAGWRPTHQAYTRELRERAKVRRIGTFASRARNCYLLWRKISASSSLPRYKRCFRCRLSRIPAPSGPPRGLLWGLHHGVVAGHKQAKAGAENSRSD